MSRLAAHAEILKLARLLGTAAERFSYLEGKPVEEIRELRAHATDALFAEGGHGLERLAAPSKIMPAAVTAKIGHALGPVLAARVAGSLDPARAVEVASHLPPDFVAEIAIHIDPRKARDVIAGMPSHLVAKWTPLLVEREEWVTMGRFLGSLSDEAIEAAVKPLDGEVLVRTGIVTEDTSHMDAVVAMLSDEQLAEVVEAAVEHQLWPEALSLLGHFGRDTLGRFAEVTLISERHVLEQIVSAAQSEGLWEDLLPLIPLLPEPGREHVDATIAGVGDEDLSRILEAAAEHGQFAPALSLLGHLGEDTRQRFAELPVTSERRVLEGLVAAATEEEMWLDMLPLVTLLPPEGRAQVAQFAAEVDPEILIDILRAAGERDLWHPMIDLISRMEGAAMARVAELIGEVGEGELYSLVGAVVERELYTEVLAIAGRIPEPHFTAIARHMVEIGAEPLTPAIVTAAHQTGLWKEGLELLAAVGPDLQERLVEPVSQLGSDDRAAIASHAAEHGVLDRLGPLRSAIG